MKIELNRLNDAFHLEATNEQGKSIQIDASPDIGELNLGMRPMQLLLAGMGGCSNTDPGRRTLWACGVERSSDIS